MSSAPGICQTYPAYTSDAPEDVSTALQGSGEGSLCTQVHAPCGSPLYGTPKDRARKDDNPDNPSVLQVQYSYSCSSRVRVRSRASPSPVLRRHRTR